MGRRAAHASLVGLSVGDADTTCAIVGGIVVLGTGEGSIPASWLAAREPLDSIE